MRIEIQKNGLLFTIIYILNLLIVVRSSSILKEKNSDPNNVTFLQTNISIEDSEKSSISEEDYNKPNIKTNVFRKLSKNSKSNQIDLIDLKERIYSTQSYAHNIQKEVFFEENKNNITILNANNDFNINNTESHNQVHDNSIDYIEIFKNNSAYVYSKFIIFLGDIDMDLKNPQKRAIVVIILVILTITICCLFLQLMLNMSKHCRIKLNELNRENKQPEEDIYERFEKLRQKNHPNLEATN